MMTDYALFRSTYPMICMLDFDRGLNNTMLISLMKHRIETFISIPGAF